MLIPAAVMDELPFLKAVHITRDGKYLLLNAGRYYCAAIGTEPLTCLDELCGAALTGCSYIGEGIFSCHSLTGGAVDEADLAVYVRGETPASPIDFGMITTWNVDVQRQAALAARWPRRSQTLMPSGMAPNERSHFHPDWYMCRTMKVHICWRWTENAISMSLICEAESGI